MRRLLSIFTLYLVLLGCFPAVFVRGDAALPACCDPVHQTRSAVGSQYEAIVYTSSRGDIYTRDLATGATRRLTTDGRNSAPKWSPSGRWIAFDKADYKYDPKPCPCPGDDNPVRLWVMRRDGSDARRVPLIRYNDWIDNKWAWSRSGDLAFLSKKRRLAIYRPGMKVVRTIVAITTADSRIRDFAWAHDGRSLVYVVATLKVATADKGVNPTERGNFAYVIWRTDIAGKNRRRLYRTREQAGLRLWGLSADDRYLVFWAEPYEESADYVGAVPLDADGMSLWNLLLDGGSPRLIAGTIEGQPTTLPSDTNRPILHRVADVNDMDVTCAPGNIDVASNGRYAAVDVGFGRRSWQERRWIIRFDTRTGRVKRLTPPTVHATDPITSPDSRYILYRACRQQKPIYERNDKDGPPDPDIPVSLWVMHADGTHKREIVHASEQLTIGRAVWTVDGTIIFEEERTGGVRKLRKIRPDAIGATDFSILSSDDWDILPPEARGI